MRRKQTAFFVTLLILSSLVFVSQTRPQAPVSSVDPPDLPGSGPMAVDQDEDLIPDIHEVIFGEARNIDTPFGVIVVNGLDPMNGSDNVTDFDRDGASALLEYCWPWTLDTCFTERLSLTGKSPDETDSGFREYLDPRESDTDGDGLPDGYEIYMCTEGGAGYQNQATSEWHCLYFDPLDDSDALEDADLCIEQASEWGCGDGFDVNRDGEIDLDERYTNSEEYWFGAPADWVTERDGLWCSGKMPNLHPEACQDEVERPTSDDGWLGSDPRRMDSDHYTWSELIPTSLAVPGDGIPDGWEAYHGLDPRNASDAILDSDSDGWDVDRDGFIIPDSSIATARWGEAFSNYEEYLIHIDSGNWVRPGLRGLMLTGESDEVMLFDQGTNPMLVDGRVHTVLSDNARDRLLIGSAYGITAIDPFGGISMTFDLPTGMEMFTMMRWNPASEDYLILGTNHGIHSLILENGLPQMQTLTESDLGSIQVMKPLQTGSGDLDLILLGHGSKAWRITISEPSSGTGNPDFTEAIAIETLTEMLDEVDASFTEVIHVPMAGRGPMMIVGTDRGMIRWDTTDGTPSIGQPFWIYTTENAEEYVQFADLLNQSKSAVVNVMELAGPLATDGSLEEVTGVWLGTPGGVHLIDLELFVGLPKQAFNTDRMFNLERWEEGANDVRSILAIDDQILIGSRDGTWALEGGSQGVLGIFENQTRMPGLVTSLTTSIHDGNQYLFAGVSPGEYMNIMPINPQSIDSDLDGMPDGWEFAYGLDPTDPYDRDRDEDADVVYFDVNGISFNREWS